MTRLFALLVAVGLVVGALYVRGRLDRGEPLFGAPRPAGQDGTQEPDDDGFRLVCATELAAACSDPALQAAEVTVEPAGATAAAVAEAPAAADLDFDLWLVPQPWPEVAAVLRDPTLPPLEPTGTSEVLARSPLVLAGFEERVAALETACGRALDWRCVGEQAGRPWTELGLADAPGTVRPGHLDPTTSATGLAVLGEAVASWAGRADLARADLDSPGFADWFGRMEDAVPSFAPTSGSQLLELQTRYLASYDVIGTTEAEIVTRPSVAVAGRQPIVVRWPEPGASAEVVVATYGRDAPESLLDALGPALAGAGWRVGDDAPEGLEGAPAAPPEGGLPGAGFLVALQQRWEEQT